MTGGRRSTGQSLCIGAGAGAILLWSAGPFVWQASTSLQDDKALMAATPSFWPSPITFSHYYNVFVAKHFQLYVLNSLIVAGLAALLCLVAGGLAAFSLSRLRIRQRFGVLNLILSVSMFPQIALVGPLYLVAADLGLLDTYASLVLTYLALGVPLVTWVLFGYFETLPRELDEAARIDGIGPIGLLVRIVIPLTLPALVTTGLLAFIAAWNEFMFALAFASTVEHQTIPVGIANFTNLYYVPWGDVAAASVVVTIPLIGLVLLFQRHIIEGLTQGAVKE
jgi:ABC-type glycerol-3-phosphate transport system permease component